MKNSTLLISGILTGFLLFVLTLFGLDCFFIAIEAEEAKEQGLEPYFAD